MIVYLQQQTKKCLPKLVPKEKTQTKSLFVESMLDDFISENSDQVFHSHLENRKKGLLKDLSTFNLHREVCYHFFLVKGKHQMSVISSHLSADWSLSRCERIGLCLC